LIKMPEYTVVGRAVARQFWPLGRAWKWPRWPCPCYGPGCWQFFLKHVTSEKRFNIVSQCVTMKIRMCSSFFCLIKNARVYICRQLLLYIMKGGIEKICDFGEEIWHTVTKCHWKMGLVLNPSKVWHIA